MVCGNVRLRIACNAEALRMGEELYVSCAAYRLNILDPSCTYALHLVHNAHAEMCNIVIMYPDHCALCVRTLIHMHVQE
jgi:hypothetical protein